MSSPAPAGAPLDKALEALREKENIQQVGIVWFDLETTGLSTQTDEAIEIAATFEPACTNALMKYHEEQKAKFGRGFELPVISHEFYALIKPAKPIPAEATKIHGITNEMVADKPSFREEAQRFVKWLQQWTRWCLPTGKLVLVAHNNFYYDAVMLCRQVAESKLHLPVEVVMADSIVAFRECFPFPYRKFKLEALANLWIKKNKDDAAAQTIQDHRAKGDVLMLRAVVQSCPSANDFLVALLRGARPVDNGARGHARGAHGHA
jgi:DNA polymerase III epsilon subunit-like protein